MGNDFVQKHMEGLGVCKQTAQATSGVSDSVKTDPGSAKEVLFYPGTKLNACARDGLVKEKFVAPPHPDCWVGIYFENSH